MGEKFKPHIAFADGFWWVLVKRLDGSVWLHRQNFLRACQLAKAEWERQK